jgi:hypothetical protein
MVVRLILPERAACPSKPSVDLSRRVTLNAFGDAREVPSRSEQHVDVVGHHAPAEQIVALIHAKEKRTLHKLGMRRLLQKKRARGAAIEELVRGREQEFAFANTSFARRFAYARTLAAQLVALTAQSIGNMARKGAFQIPGEEDRTPCRHDVRKMPTILSQRIDSLKNADRK